MSPLIDIPAGQQQQAYEYYCRQPAVPLETIATFLGVSPSTFRRLRKGWGWPSRREALAQRSGRLAATNAAGELNEPDGKPVAGASLRDAALALSQVTRAHLDAFVDEQRAGRDFDHDKAARTLASFAKTLTTAQALLDQDGSEPACTEDRHDDARSIHDLRDELARHLERIVAEEEARGGDGLLV